MFIQMICGTFGAREGDTIVAKNNKSAPFEVEKERGMQLIDLGYAKEINGLTMVDADKTAEDNGGNKEKEWEDYSIQELRKIAREVGVSGFGGKNQIIERIVAAGKETKKGEGKIEEDGEVIPPLLVPAEPEVQDELQR